jgi:hypothetical protein
VSDPATSQLQELTSDLGAGPGMDATAQAGIRAVFALPLQAAAIRLDVLDLYAPNPATSTA